MKILIISRSPWRMDNSFGNTYSNIFSDMKNIKIANIYLADGLPDKNNKNVVAYYRISEKAVLRSLFHKRSKSNKVGEIITEDMLDFKTNITNVKHEIFIKKMRTIRWSIFYLAREITWKFGQINLTELMNFVKDFKPDIIFLPLYYALYVSRIALYIKKNYDIPIVTEASIDIYSMKQLSFDPFFWINRIWIRSMIRKVINKSEKLYVISEKMKNDYQKMLGINCSVLYKFPDKDRKKYDYILKSNDLLFLYTGNIGTGRWASLASLGKALNESGLGKLVIYTPTPITSKMKKALKYCEICDPVSSEEVIALQNKADVLVHSESFKLKHKLQVRYSISTKIMDYISVERCIFAIGPSDIASIEFLERNQLAIIATSNEAISKMIDRIKSNKLIIKMYAENNKKYVEQIISRTSLQESLYNDMIKIIETTRGIYLYEK